MSRLIDADEAIKRLGDAHFKNYGNAIMVIRETPTVDAVPVSFIQQEIDGYCKDEAVTTPNTIIHWIINSKRIGLQYLIERWRREQEKQK